MAFEWDDVTEFFDDDWTLDYYIDGNVYKGIPYDRSNSASVIAAGLSSGINQSVMFKLEDFDTLPAVDDIVIRDGTEYRVLQLREDSTLKTFTVDLAEKYG